MKRGDLVKMKPETWWKMYMRKFYTEIPCLIIDVEHNSIRVLYDGKPKKFLAEYWDLV